MSHQKAASKILKVLSQFLNRLDLESGPYDSCFALHLKIGNALVEEAWVEAVDWHELSLLGLLVDCPIQDCVVMNSEIISEP